MDSLAENPLVRDPEPNNPKRKMNFREWLHNRQRARRNGKGQDEDVQDGGSEATGGLKRLVQEKKTSEKWSKDDLKRIVTAENLCRCPDPIITSFKVSSKLREFATTYTENTSFLKKLDVKVESFAYMLMDQVTSEEQLVIQDECGDRYGSLLSDITDKAIVYGQKKFVSHPLLYDRLQRRWNFGLPESLQPHGKFRYILIPITILETALTLFFLPIIGYASFRDQRKSTNAEETFLDKYLNYYTSPIVLFIKDKLSLLIFIALHIRICTSGSSVPLLVEEYMICLFFCGLVLSEYQKYQRSPCNVYFKDMWNYLDIITFAIYMLIVFLRIRTIVFGGDPYENRLLEVVNYLYGFNAAFLVLRFSSILELSSSVGPLQLAMCRMLTDLLTVLLQFGFVVMAFSVAITKAYTAENSYVTPGNESAVIDARYTSIMDTSVQLVWSVFDLTDLSNIEPHTSMTSNIVAILYLMFLILTVILVVNVTNNADVEWKFARAVLESSYQRLHAVVVPFNLISVPVMAMYLTRNTDKRQTRADKRLEAYRKFHKEVFFPEICKRYQRKYGEDLPLLDEEKINWIITHLRRQDKTKTAGMKPEVYVSTV